MFSFDEIQDALADRKEFKATEANGAISFDYNIALPDTFLGNDDKAWVRRNLRGITFCANTKQLLSLPFHKFFNVNENAQSQYNLHKNKSARIYEKCDGTMIHFFKTVDGHLFASTCRSSNTPQAQYALQIANSDSNFLANISASIDAGNTPMFEYVGPENQIVVQYSSSKLIYLCSRNRSMGNYIFEESFNQRAKCFDIKFSDIFNFCDQENFEGYVCYLEDGNIFKVKTPWYLERHRCIDVLMKPAYKIYEIALNGIMDDVLAKIDEKYKKVLLQILQTTQQDLMQNVFDLEKKFSEAIKQVQFSCGVEKWDFTDAEAKKSFVLFCQKNYNDLMPEFMQLYKGASCESLIKKKLIKKYQELHNYKIWQNI